MASAPRRSAKPQITDVGAVDADRAGFRIVEAQQQIEDRGLARARRADNGHRLARRDAEVETIERQRVGPRRIAERDLLEAHAALHRLGQGLGIDGFDDDGRFGAELGQALGRTGGALQVADRLADGAARARHQHGIENEGREVAGADAPADHVVTAHPQQEADGGEDDEDHQRRHDGAPGDAAAGGVEGAFRRLAEAPGGAVLLGEGLHGAHRIERLAAFRYHVGHARLRFARQRADLAAEQDDRRHDKRHHGQHEQRELGVGDHQHGHAADAHQHVAQRHRGRRADDLLDQLRVGRDAAHDVARPLDLEPGRPQPYDMGEQVAAQVAHHALAQPGDQVEARTRGDRQHDRHGEQRSQRIVQDIGPALGKAAVDQGAQAGAEGQHRAGRHQQRQQRQRHPAAIGPEIGAEEIKTAESVHCGCHASATPSSPDRWAIRSGPPRVSFHCPVPAS